MAVINAKFPLNYWDPKISAQVLALEVLQNTAWQGIALTPGIPTGKLELEKELDDILDYQTHVRAGKMADIQVEDKEPMIRFQNLLVFESRSAPRTYELMMGMLHVGNYVAVYFKYKFQRARPSQLDPRIRPGITVPPHASYPSGHSLQMHLMAHALAEVAPAVKDSLLEVAMTVAVNREIAGVHYNSDTLVSKNLALDVYRIAKPTFQPLITAAKKEWTDVYP